MIVVLLNVYLVLLFILVKLKIVPFNLFWKISPVIVFLLLMIGLFIPMNWGAPQGTELVVRNSVAVVPNVAGEVTDVPIEPNKPIKANDVLFKIDPVPFQSQVDALGAQLKFAELRLSQMTQLQRADTGRAFDVEQRQSEVDQFRAQFEGAKWNLEQTVVRAPADGYVTNLALRKGACVASLPLSPVMAFIDTSDTLIGVEIQQIDARYIRPGQFVEATFKFFPGKVFSGKVEAVLQALSTGQTQVSGQAVTPRQIQSAPFVVRIRLDDADVARQLPAGSTGDAAIFTDHVKAAHVIRRYYCGRLRSRITSIRFDEEFEDAAKAKHSNSRSVQSTG
jgi:RND family efflux transporter MFP subunit